MRVRLFAMQRELAGTRDLELELPDGATIEDSWVALVERFPRLASGRAAVRFARNGAYTDARTSLADGDEVAMIPPVSGGAGEDAGPGDASTSGDPSSDGDTPIADDPSGSARAGRIRILEIRAEPFPASVLAELGAQVATPDDGAVVAFLGVTRRAPGTPAPGQEAEAARHAGRSVEALTYEALEPMAISVMSEIADEIEERFGVTRLAIVHREGDVPLGEASVAIVAASPHRDAAFDAARYAIDETKGRAPIWKAERFSDGHVWIGEPARSGPPDS